MFAWRFSLELSKGGCQLVFISERGSIGNLVESQIGHCEQNRNLLWHGVCQRLSDKIMQHNYVIS